MTFSLHHGGVVMLSQIKHTNTTQTNEHKHTHWSTHTHTNTKTHTHTNKQTNTHIYTHTYTHIHIHTHTATKIHPLAHILDTWALIFSSCALFSLSQLHHVTSSLPSRCDNHQSTGGRSERAKNTEQKWPRETLAVTNVPGLSTLSDL